MSTAIRGRTLGEELLNRGLIPQNCRLLDLVVGVEGVVIVKYEKFLTTDEMVQFAEAMKTVAEAKTISKAKE